MLRKLCAVDVRTQPEGALPDIQSTEEAVRYLRAKRRLRGGSGTRPYLLAVGLHKPHVPFKFPKEFLDVYPLQSIIMPPDPYRDVAISLIIHGALKPWYVETVVYYSAFVLTLGQKTRNNLFSGPG